MCGGGGDGGAGEIRRAEDEREAKAADAIRRVNMLFGVTDPNLYKAQDFGSGYNIGEWGANTASANDAKRESLYSSTGDDVAEYLRTQHDDYYGDAKRTAKFALARAGLSGGQVDTDLKAKILETFNRGVLDVRNRADSTVSEIRGADEQALGVDEAAQATAVYTAAEVTLAVARSGGVGRITGANNFGIPYTVDSTGVPTTAAPVFLNHVYATGGIARVNYAFVRKWVGVTEPAISGVDLLTLPHDHSSGALGGSALAPASIDCSGVISSIQTGAGLGGFALNANVATDNTDCHGLIVNAKSTTPSASTHIANIRFSLNGLPRWTIKKAGSPDNETGGNAGSSLYFSPHADAGGAAMDNLAPIMSRDGRFSVPSVPPASATAAGRAGTITWDANYIYICTATDTWKRVAIATW